MCAQEHTVSDGLKFKAGLPDSSSSAIVGQPPGLGIQIAGSPGGWGECCLLGIGIGASSRSLVPPARLGWFSPTLAAAPGTRGDQLLHEHRFLPALGDSLINNCLFPSY